MSDITFNSDCYYLDSTSSTAAGNGVEARTAAQLRTNGTYSSWPNFSTTWNINPAINNGYPYLIWFWNEYGEIVTP